MSTDTADRAKQSNAYELFIFMLTVLSLGIMVVLLLPLSDATIHSSRSTTTRSVSSS